MKVRKATTADIPRICELGAAFWATTKQGESASYDSDAVAAMAQHMIDDVNGAVFVAETEEGEVVGGCAGLVYPVWMAPGHLTGQEMFWYVDPDHRRSRAGQLMFDALESWARDERKTHSFTMIALAGLHEKRVGQMYESKGYFSAEHSYLKVF